MKSGKFSFLILIIALLLLLSSCGLFNDRHPYIDSSNVESVQIIELGKYIDWEAGYEYTVLAEVTDCKVFIDRLNKIETAHYWGGSMMMYEGDVVIRIQYKNGDYDKIGKVVSTYKRSGVTNYGNFNYNVEQFDTLISDYLT